ncbi:MULTISPECIES: hypothetical protein [unclassified Shinella]|uniref:AtuA-related protein n=1 Tax=unclassified Shinella TaxID=2643062 RepID=UPI00225CAA81|nr:MULTISPECIES: hypothetical protein [unclassified Shinella]MCO5139080.1 hypothetical protein [Shinella sp.]MDC7256190.1 hypothetical protein [Shinella sp. YE25]CAI0339039.1 Beta-lactamase [Rhizobiaceae bacterium]CAK7257457.1 Beta-lactamase [Shinella sp. WSC3-e]
MSQAPHRVVLRDICHARSGDKGNSANVGIACFDARDYEWLERNLSAAAVKAFMKSIVKGSVERYELPNVAALNFMLHDALGGGASRTLQLDIHGKGFSSILLSMELTADDRPPSLREAR